MKKFITSHVPLLLVVICFLILNCVFWPIVGTELGKDPSSIHITVWLGYGFVTGCYVLCGLVTFLKVFNKNVVTSFAPIFIVTFGYLVVASIFNLIGMIVNTDNYLWDLITNIILLLIFVAVFLIVYKHFTRVDDNTKRREERVKDWRTIAVTVSNLKSYSEDEEINSAITKLYDDVKYSSSASSDKTKEIETEFEEQITAIKMMLKNDSDKETVLKALKTAEKILQNRNQLLAIR